MGENSLYWVLQHAPGTRNLAEHVHGQVQREQVICPIESGHRRGGKRLTNLSVLLRGKQVHDFVWTWQSECLISTRVLRLLREAGFTGFDVRPVKVQFKRDCAKRIPVLWELICTGWGGLARPESGVKLVSFCSGCQYSRYLHYLDGARLIDDSKWDGSDFFMVWPLPLFIFVTTNVANFIRENHFTGVVTMPTEQLGPDPHGPIKFLTPGRLSYYMPEDRAAALAEVNGIKEI